MKDYKKIVEKLEQYCLTHEEADIHDIMEILEGNEI